MYGRVGPTGLLLKKVEDRFRVLTQGPMGNS